VSVDDARTRELDERLQAVRARVQRACAVAGRSVDDVTVVVVTKTFPADDVQRLVGLAVRDVAENRDQEAKDKVRAVAASGVPGVEQLRWHFVGQLQRNKAASVARYAHVVHSLDRPGLVEALSKGAVAAGRELAVLLQVDLDPPGQGVGRGGTSLEELPALAEQVLGAPGLVLRGVMGVAPLGGDPQEAFGRLAVASARLQQTAPQATWISAGMSGDLEQAVACGATHLRVGSAVLGSRPSLR
jgi:pyridoxal phosphate enzyme (YggS family)